MGLAVPQGVKINSLGKRVCRQCPRVAGEVNSTAEVATEQKKKENNDKKERRKVIR